MSADDRFWNRDELYEEVWATPMRTLAKKYGISDVGLAKICRKLSIPLPGLGYWARKQAGQKVRRLELPPLKEKIVLQRPIRKPEEPPLSNLATAEEVARVEDLEQISGEFFLKQGSLSHPLIVQTRSAFRHAQILDNKILRAESGGLDVRVSKESLDRAIRIMAAIVAAIEELGFTVAIESQQTVVRMYGQVIRFGLAEKINRIEVIAQSKEGPFDRVLTYGSKFFRPQLSGRLLIEAGTAWKPRQRSWIDGKAQCLEDQIPRAIAGFMRLALASRAEQQRRDAEKHEERRIAEECANLAKSIKAEQSKVSALRNATAQWLRAQQIRSFVSVARDTAVQKGQSTQPGSQFGDWIIWALQQADRLDPLKESPPSIIDRQPETNRFRFPKPIWRMK
jgi:hypothetical protein